MFQEEANAGSASQVFFMGLMKLAKGLSDLMKT
jgi:hypothetical protein